MFYKRAVRTSRWTAHPDIEHILATTAKSWRDTHNGYVAERRLGDLTGHVERLTLLEREALNFQTIQEIGREGG